MVSLDVFMTEEFLDGADVVADLEEVSSKGMAEGMGRYRFIDSGKPGSLFDLPSEDLIRSYDGVV